MKKKPYIRPSISKQTIGVMNKFGNTFYKSYKDRIDGVPVEELIQKFGSPLFVFSEKSLRAQYRKISGLFETRYPNVQFSWSYKTNYLNAICAVMHDEGEIAEVVSEFEYDKARHLGVKGSEIIFNGPHKGATGLEKAFRENAIVNLDNFDEIYLAEKVARKLNKNVKVGIRLNMDTGIKPHWSRFGFNLDNKQAREAVNRIAKSEFLTLRGLHTHIGTFVLDTNAYAIAVKKVVGFMHEIEDQFKTKMDYLDFGGGFPSKNRLKGIYLPPESAIPPYEDYAEAICSTLLQELRPGEYPKLYLESGRAMVDESGSLITSVISRVTQPDGTRGYNMDAGVNVMYTATWYNYKIEPTREIQGSPEACKLYGPLCMNIDVIAESVYLPPLSVGDSVALSPMGAYNVTQWMQFIAYRPAIVMIMEDGAVEIIRKRETLEDVMGPEVLPEKFKSQTLSKTDQKNLFPKNELVTSV